MQSPRRNRHEPGEADSNASRKWELPAQPRAKRTMQDRAKPNNTRQGISRAEILMFFCADLALIRCLRKSPQYLLVMLQRTRTVSANLRKTSTTNTQNNIKSWLAKFPNTRTPETVDDGLHRTLATSG